MSAQQDDDAFTELFHRHCPAVLRYAQRRVDGATAWDVVSEAFLVAWRQRHRLPQSAEEQLPWLYTIAANAIRNADRSQHRHDLRTERAGRVILQPPGRDPAEVIAARQDTIDVDRAMAQLRVADREVLRLIGWEQLELSAAAVVLHVSYGAAKVRLHRARRRLRQALHALAADEPPHSVYAISRTTVLPTPAKEA